MLDVIMKITSYKDLIVWQKAMELVTQIYSVTDDFPQKEIYGLTSQMRRAAVSIPSNISEGSRRGTRKDYRQFLTNAFGSGAELETQMEISLRLFMANPEKIHDATMLLDEVMKMLNVMIKRLNDSPTHYKLPTTHS